MNEDRTLAQKRILLVDDEPSLRGLLKEEFESRGAEVVEAANGEEAFRIATASIFDAIVSDIRMRGGDGIKLLENIRLRDAVRPVFVILSGYTDIGEQDLYKMGANAIFPKPFSLDLLMRELARLLNSNS